MPFKRTPQPAFEWPVNLTRPGETQPAKAVFSFKHKSKPDLDDWVKRSGESKSAADDAVLLREIVGGWDVEDDDGKPLPIDQDSMRAMVEDFPSFAFEVTTAYMKAMGESRAKN